MSAAAAAERWGTTTAAWTATTDLPVGAVVGAGDVVLDARPVAFVADDAVADDPTGRTVRAPLRRGEVVTGRSVAGADRTGVAALVPDGWRGVAIPVHDGALPVEPGQHVDVLAAGDPETTGGWAGTVVVAGAVVVHVAEDDTVTVAVPATDAPRVAAALVGAVVTLALAP